MGVFWRSKTFKSIVGYSKIKVFRVQEKYQKTTKQIAKMDTKSILFGDLFGPRAARGRL